MKGFINLYKPAGMSSAAAVSVVKKKFHVPCGHMGTLDPMAEGILPIGLGKTTRLFRYLLDKEKRYIAKFKFGISTDTLDTTGKVTKVTELVPTADEINEILPRFIGKIAQVPPKYSAKCIDGKRGYQLARNGVEFELPPKEVIIKNVTLNGQTAPDEFEFTIDCLGGTYIRSLARDIGEACNTVAVMSSLIRARAGAFCIENSVKLEDFKESDDAEKFILASEIAVDYEKLVLTAQQSEKILNGIFPDYGFADGIYRVYNESEFWGIGEAKEGILKINAYVR